MNDEQRKIEIPSNIPPKYQEKYAVIAGMIIPFCNEHLDAEYTDLCIHALQKLCRKRNEPLSSGRNNMWAAGIVYAIAQNCNLIGNNRDIYLGIPKYRLRSDEICGACNVSKGGVSEKAKVIKKELSITQGKNEWLVSTMQDANNVMKDFKRLMKGFK